MKHFPWLACSASCWAQRKLIRRKTYAVASHNLQHISTICRSSCVDALTVYKHMKSCNYLHQMLGNEECLTDGPFCGQICKIWPYFNSVGRTIFGLAVWCFSHFLRWPCLKIILQFILRMKCQVHHFFQSRLSRVCVPPAAGKAK